MIYLIIQVLYIIVMLVYFRIANRYNIVDHPNKRSSHSHSTIRGAGIIFLFAAVIATIMHSEYCLMMFGIFIIGIVSFLDDLRSLPSLIRVVFQLIAVTLSFIYLNLFSTWPVITIVLFYILVIGIVNAYNFMDGINGITGTYSLVIFAGLQYINLRQFHFIEADMIWLPMLACVVFLYFNFRKKAKCFAGDVGSLTIALWIITLLLRLIFISNNWAYILFLAVYGVDTVLTIIHRLWLKQNIFTAHRLHFYQLLTNEQRLPHLVVAFFYALTQTLIIIWIINNPRVFWVDFTLICIPLIVAYVALKPRLTKGKYS